MEAQVFLTPIERFQGFALVPDFAGTEHAFCGTTQDAAVGDLLLWHKKPTRDEMLRVLHNSVARSARRKPSHSAAVQPAPRSAG